MSPEQCQGRHVDLRSDIYSLGCVMFEALTGTSPFVGENAMTTMMMHTSNAVPSLKEASLGTDFPPALEQIIRKMLKKPPAHRYQNLGRAAMDLAALQRGETPILKRDAVTAKPSIKLSASSKNSAKEATANDTRSGAVSFTKVQLLFYTIGCCVISAIIAALTLKMFTPTTSSTVTPLQHSNSDSALETTQAQNSSSSKPELAKKSYYTTNSLPPTSNPFVQDMERNQNTIERNVDVNDAQLQYLKSYYPLQQLTIKDTNVSDAGLLALKNLKLLSLSLIGCEKIRTGETLENLPYLQTLYLGKSGITNDALKHIAKLKMLSHLHLKEAENISIAGLRHLVGSRSLRVVVLDKAWFNQQDIENLSKRMPYCTFPGFVEEPRFTRAMTNKEIIEATPRPAPYKPSP